MKYKVEVEIRDVNIGRAINTLDFNKPTTVIVATADGVVGVPVGRTVTLTWEEPDEQGEHCDVEEKEKRGWLITDPGYPIALNNLGHCPSCGAKLI